MNEISDYTVFTESDEDTVELGSTFGKCLKHGDVVALAGELGSGKTWFTKGIARGLGISRNIIVTSPSFALVNEYPGRITLYHIDVYRLETLPQLFNAGVDEYFHVGGVAVVEWADRWPHILPEDALKVKLVILDEHSRSITFSVRPGRGASVLEALKISWKT
ncbi:MAG: tRNA (adenosine(37)-N6)-threonylcarbamoyltransferase complex ATPase subunit type 1 TsaE [Deltaproteobacteria bacterium]|nr:tRNA (adenosine(37)-N6)-threonylcarbamoyltransferase complex ATPase subunit type 1 TsaE [Deltaproteobacteria bacterium]